MTKENGIEAFISDFQLSVTAWHIEHFGADNPAWKPLGKATEELGEVWRALNLDDEDGVARELGDVIIALSAFASKFGIDLGAAASRRWAEIRRRSHERVTEQHRTPEAASTWPVEA